VFDLIQVSHIFYNIAVRIQRMQI